MTTLLRALGFMACLVSALPSAVLAVVLATGDGSGNTTPPPDDPGFANVGTTPSQLSGIYLGDRWVLTAHHVGEQDLRFGGVLYPVAPGSSVQLVTDGVGADLMLLRLQTAPPLPDLRLASEPMEVGEVAMLVGSGYPRLPDLFCWDAAFLERVCSGSASITHRGFKKQGGERRVRWGRNEVAAVDRQDVLNGRTTRHFMTLFDEAGVADEAQPVVGDSGGAVFVERGGTWELAGVMFAQSAWPAQPENTAVFGDLGIHADVFFYREQILDLMVSPPVVPMLPLGFLGATIALLAASAAQSLRRASTSGPSQAGLGQTLRCRRGQIASYCRSGSRR